MKKVTAILTADLHIRDTSPLCRIDDYIHAQINKLNFIYELSEKHQCLTYIAGDIFDKAKTSPFVESMALSYLPDNAIVIPGNHCLPSHNLNNLNNSSLGVLQAANKVNILYGDNMRYFDKNNNVEIYGFPFGIKLKNSNREFTGKKVALVHQMIHLDKKIHKSMESTAGISLLKNSNYDLIVTGDNHQPFTVEYEGRLLVNCGSMMRMTADQIDYKPAVWLWYSEDNTVEKVYLPIEENVVSRTHIELKELKDNRMNAFVESVNKSYEIGLSFRDNLESYFLKNDTRNGIKEKIYESLES